MTSINELFPKCRKLAYDARQQVFQVQQNHMPISDLHMSIDELEQQLNIMQELVYRETPAQREVWNRKIEELRHECQSLRQQGQAVAYQRQYQNDRHELLRRRRRNNENEQNDLHNLAQESQSLQNSTNMVMGLIDQGAASLDNLVNQRQSLRGVKNTVLDISDRLGLTQSTMRIIERRDITDAYLVAAGMVVTLIVIYFVWF